ncbi:MAG: cupin domain-containing protein [Gemmatimonadales bacterium]|jgi:anti-sigma factor ChrR (cupin superfamily)
MSAITLNTNHMPWQEAESYPEGTSIKLLRDEGETKSALLRLPPGFRMDAHTHTCAEQHFVLEGEYEVDGKEYGPGTYQYIPARFRHGPFASRDGAVVLVAWEG